MRRGLVWSLVFMIGAAVAAISVTLALGDRPLLGLDLKGGVSVVLQPQGTATSAELNEAVQIIDRRVNGLGVSNSQVTKQGNDVVINLPGIKDSSAALQELGQTATLYFRPVMCEIPIYAPPTKSSAAPKTSPTTKAPTTPTTKKAAGGSSTSYRLASATFQDAVTPTGPAAPSSGPGSQSYASSACSSASSSSIPSTAVSQDNGLWYVILPDYTNSIRYVLGPADMTGQGISDASEQLTSAGEYQVLLTFNNAGSSKFDQIASQRYPCYQQNTSNPPPCSLEAFELDGVVESAPTIQASSFNGQATISGSTSNPFTSSQASKLALVLKYGSLPVRFTPQSVQTVSATIGKDSLRAGLAAGIGGIAVVLLYMVIYYRLLGLVVWLGLAVGGSLLYSIITLLSHTKNLTLTLAGVVGIIVSVGITVDSYVVYFERLKDEVRAGRTIRQSVERSFTRAFRTVLTADFVAFLAALILYWLTVGDVRGFAFMLGLSTLLDVATAFLFIRPMVILVGRRRAFTEAPFLGVARGLGGGAVTSEA